jgi:hypothetical protein
MPQASSTVNSLVRVKSPIVTSPPTSVASAVT